MSAPQPQCRTRQELFSREPMVVALLCCLSALVLYTLTLAPTFGWGDSADLALRLAGAPDRTFVGGSRDYALFRAVGGLFQTIPIGDAGWRANFATACFGALGVGIMAVYAWLLTGSRFAMIVTASAILVSHTYWFLSVTAEVYTFDIVLVYGAFAAVTLWSQTGKAAALALAAILAGLSVAHHATGIVTVASMMPMLWICRRRLSFAQLIVAAVLLLLCSAPFWIPALRRTMQGASLMHVLLLDESNSLHKAAPAREAVKLIAYSVYNFVGPALLLAPVGAVVVIRRRLIAIVPSLIWGATFAIAGIVSSIPDKFNVYVVVYPTIALLAGVGASYLETFQPGLRSKAAVVALALLSPPVVYLTTIKTSQSLHVDLVGARHAPFRDNNWYFLWPAKNGDWGPRRFAAAALGETAQNGVLVADYTLWRPLLFLQLVEGRRPDVRIQFVEPLFRHGVDRYIAQVPCDRAVYLATDDPPDYYELPAITRQFALERQKVVVRVIRPCEHS